MQQGRCIQRLVFIGVDRIDLIDVGAIARELIARIDTQIAVIVGPAGVEGCSEIGAWKVSPRRLFRGVVTMELGVP